MTARCKVIIIQAGMPFKLLHDVGKFGLMALIISVVIECYELCV